MAVVIGFGGLLASFSRSSWVSTLAGVLVILWLSGKLRYFFIGVFAFILLVLGLKEFVPYAEYIFERFASIFTLFDEFGSTAALRVRRAFISSWPRSTCFRTIRSWALVGDPFR